MMRFVFSIFVSLFIGGQVVHSVANEPQLCICPAAPMCDNIYADFHEAVEQSKERSRTTVFVLFSYFHDEYLAQCLLCPEELGCAAWSNFASFVILQPNCACETSVPEHLCQFKNALQTFSYEELRDYDKELLEQVISSEQDKPSGIFLFTFGLGEDQSMALFGVEKIENV